MFAAGLRDLITYNPWSVPAEAPFAELARLLDGADCHHWPVVDDAQRLVGVLSADDLVRAAVEQSAAAAAVAAGVAGPTATRALRADEIMSPRVVSITPREPPLRALTLLLEAGFHSLPVVDEGRLVGMITTADFVREYSYGEAPSSQQAVSRLAAPAEEPLEVDAALEEAAVAFHAVCGEHLAVILDGLPLGVVSRREVRLAKGREALRELLGPHAVGPGPTTVRELVTQAPALKPGQKLSEAAGVLAERGLQAAAVVNQAHRLVGVLSEEALLRALREDLGG